MVKPRKSCSLVKPMLQDVNQLGGNIEYHEPAHRQVLLYILTKYTYVNRCNYTHKLARGRSDASTSLFNTSVLLTWHSPTSSWKPVPALDKQYVEKLRTNCATDYIHREKQCRSTNLMISRVIQMPARSCRLCANPYFFCVRNVMNSSTFWSTSSLIFENFQQAEPPHYLTLPPPRCFTRSIRSIKLNGTRIVV